MPALIFVFFTALSLTQVTCAATLATQTSKLSAVNGQIKNLQETLAKEQQMQTRLQQQLKDSEIIFGKTSEQITHLTNELQKQQQELDTLTITQQSIEIKLTRQRAALAGQLRAAYQLGTQNQWKIIFNQEDFNAANRHLTYYKSLNTARTKLIADIQENLSLLVKTIRLAEKHQRTLKHLLQQKQQQFDQQQRALNLRQQLIVKLGLQTKNKQQQIDLLIANQKTLQETITRLKQRELTTTGKPFEQLQGKLNWPVQGVFVASYGSPLDVGTQHLNGVVIKTAAGTPIHAVYDGKVIFADWLRGFGLLVIINHGHKYMSLYARNRVIYAKAGQMVKTGDVIAAAGNSGGFDKSALYFEMRENGAPVNPSRWCK